jgi:mannobiose 2-epimerase
MPLRFRLFIVLVMLAGLPAAAPAQPADSLLQGAFWTQQGLNVILPAWTEHARTEEGVYYAELDRTWTPQDSTTQYPGMVGRHVYSYVAAYFMSGDEAHLRRAKEALDFMIEHGWDDQYGGWYNAVTRSGTVVDADKDLFMQIYATMGVALYALATKDSTAQAYLERSRRFMREHAWDQEHGGYVDVLNRDGSVQSALKDFSPQLAPLSGYLLYLYPATRDSSYLREAERIMDLTLTHMQGPDGWVRERFAPDWTFLPDDDKNSHLNVGHNLEVAWLLLRLHALTGTERYRQEGLALTDQLLEHAFHDDSGAWLHKLRRTDRSQHPDTAVWWVQAYGNMLQLYAYRVTGAQRYRDAFRKGAEFWTRHFVDDEHGGTVLRVHLDGRVADGAKAVRTKTSYHAMEHALLNFLYLSLWVNETPATLHYRIEGPFDDTVSPLPVEATRPTIQRLLVDERQMTPPTGGTLPLNLQRRAPVPITVTVTDSTAPP